MDGMPAAVCYVCCVHKADNEQQLRDAVQSQASWQMMMFWSLVSGLRGAHHLFDPLNHFLICWCSNRAESFIQMLAAHMGEWFLFPPQCGVLCHLSFWRELVSLSDDFF